MATKLPTVKIGKKLYYVDRRLNELRNVNDPNDVESIELADVHIEKTLKPRQWKRG